MGSEVKCMEALIQVKAGMPQNLYPYISISSTPIKRVILVNPE